MTAPRDNLPRHEQETWPAMSTPALAALLHRYLDQVRRAQRHPDLPLLRSAADELQARLDRKSERSDALRRLHEWLEWDAPRFEQSPPAAPAARGHDPGQRDSQ
jgi:hypothetical protein